MVLTAAQTTAFFEHDNQMSIPHATVVQLQQEGITNVDDLADFDKNSLQQLADNLR
jgi:predicted RecB family nuclease